MIYYKTTYKFKDLDGNIREEEKRSNLQGTISILNSIEEWNKNAKSEMRFLEDSINVKPIIK